jgi:hypothetical protein
MPSNISQNLILNPNFYLLPVPYSLLPIPCHLSPTISYFGSRNRVAKFSDLVGDNTRALRIAAIKKA